MSECCNSIQSTLELSRELYTEDQRRAFYDDYRKALQERESSYDACLNHRKSCPAKGYAFWKKPPEAWRDQDTRLIKKHIEARDNVSAMRLKHPLLVQILRYGGCYS